MPRFLFMVCIFVFLLLSHLFLFAHPSWNDPLLCCDLDFRRNRRQSPTKGPNFIMWVGLALFFSFPCRVFVQFLMQMSSFLFCKIATWNPNVRQKFNLMNLKKAIFQAEARSTTALPNSPKTPPCQNNPWVTRESLFLHERGQESLRQYREKPGTCFHNSHPELPDHIQSLDWIIWREWIYAITTYMSSPESSRRRRSAVLLPCWISLRHQFLRLESQFFWMPSSSERMNSHGQSCDWICTLYARFLVRGADCVCI